MKYALLFAFTALCLATAAADVTKIVPGKYGKVTTFKKDEVITYPDFTIRFLGTRNVESSETKQAFVYYDFEIDSSGAKTKISWNSGTGAIVPAYFEVQGATYVLELRASIATKGFMKENQFVVWPKTTYRKTMSKGLLE